MRVRRLPHIHLSVCLSVLYSQIPPNRRRVFICCSHHVPGTKQNKQTNKWMNKHNKWIHHKWTNNDFFCPCASFQQNEFLEVELSRSGLCVTTLYSTHQTVLQVCCANASVLQQIPDSPRFPLKEEPDRACVQVVYFGKQGTGVGEWGRSTGKEKEPVHRWIVELSTPGGIWSRLLSSITPWICLSPSGPLPCGSHAKNGPASLGEGGTQVWGEMQQREQKAECAEDKAIRLHLAQLVAAATAGQTGQLRCVQGHEGCLTHSLYPYPGQQPKF